MRTKLAELLVGMLLTAGVAFGQGVISGGGGGGGGGASALGDLSDVTITTPANGDVLERVSGVFINRNLLTSIGGQLATENCVPFVSGGALSCAADGPYARSDYFGLRFSGNPRFVVHRNQSPRGIRFAADLGLTWYTTASSASGTVNTSIENTISPSAALDFLISSNRNLRLGGGQTMLCQDTTATTGNTLCRFQAGAGQSGNILEVLNNGGSVMSYVSSAGVISAPGFRISGAATSGYGLRGNGTDFVSAQFDLADFTGDATDIVFTSGAGLSATNVSAALDELITEMTASTFAFGNGCSATDGVLTCGKFVATTTGPLELTEIAASGAGASAGVHNVYIDSTTARWASHENGGSVKDYVAAADAQTLTNKTIDGESNTLQLRRADTDCTAETGGKVGELCLELDDDTVYSCQPTSGDCDTSGEWILVSGVAAGGTVWTSIHFPSPSSSGVGTAEPNFGGCHLNSATMTAGQYRVFMADAATQGIYCNFILPTFVAVGTAPKLVIAVGGTGTTAGDIVMSAKLGCYTSSTDSWREPDWSANTVEATIAKGTTAGVPVTATMTLNTTGANWTAGAACGVWLARLGSDGADTLENSAQLFAVTLEVPQ